jgi:hypothetical protein
MAHLHWFWRATIGVLAGALGGWLLIRTVLSWVRAPVADIWIGWGPLVLLQITPVCAYGLMTRWLHPRRELLDGETHCRKCGYILRGIPEPRCSECGERI